MAIAGPLEDPRSIDVDLFSLARGGIVLLLMAVLAPTDANAQVDTLPAKAVSIYEDAQSRYQAGDYAGAVIQLKNVLQQEPGYLPAHVLLGRTYLQQGEGASAESTLRLAQRLGADPGLTSPLLARSYLLQLKPEVLLAEIRPERFEGRLAGTLWNLRGQAHLDRGELEAADEAFQKAAEFDTGGVEHLVGGATVLLRGGDTRGAEHLARMALGRAPDDVEALNVKASAHHARGEADAALEAYDRVIELNPGHVDARIARAGLLVDIGRGDDALPDIEYVRQNHPLDLRAPYLKGVILFQEGRDREARDAYLDAAGISDRIRPELFDRRPIFGFIAALVDYTLGRYEKAEERLKPYLQVHPDSAPARKILGAIALARNAPAAAVTELELGLRSAPNDYRLLSMLGQAYLRMGYPERATALLEQANQLSAGDSEVRFNLAMSRYESGALGSAMQDLASILEDDADNTQAGLILTTVYIRRREFEKAATVAEELIQRSPANISFYNLLGSAQAGLGRIDDARVSFEKALALDSRFLPGQVNLGKLERMAGNLDRAEEHLQAALELRPDNPEVFVELSRVEGARGDQEGAIRWLEKAADTEGGAIKARLALVEIYLDTGRIQDALMTAQAAEHDAPGNVEAQLALATVHRARNRPDLARVIYERLVLNAGYDAPLLYRLARLQLQAGSREDAVWSLEKAVKGEPRFLPARLLLVDLLLGLGKVELAERHIIGQGELVGDPATLVELKGDVAAARQDHEAAAAHYRAALQQDPTTGRILRLHQALRAAGRADEAVAALENWLGERPADTTVKAALAEGLLLDGRLKAARHLYEEVLEAHPRAPSVMNNLAQLYLRSGDPRAVELAQRAHELAPNDSDINDTLGWALVQDGQPALGLKYLRNAFTLSADNLEARYHIAYALEQLGRQDAALAELRDALQADVRLGEMEGVAALRDRLERATGKP